MDAARTAGADAQVAGFSRPEGTGAPASARADTTSRKGIRDVARQLEITPRTLRFYEDKGLINPERAGNIRIYSRRDIGRMQLILRGKRLGFTLREIGDFLDLYDTEPSHTEQMEHLVARVQERLTDLEWQQSALEKTIAELRDIRSEAIAQLKQRGA
jgi:DNA-binding transcriptional MerR regulator